MIESQPGIYRVSFTADDAGRRAVWESYASSASAAKAAALRCFFAPPTSVASVECVAPQAARQS